MHIFKLWRDDGAGWKSDEGFEQPNWTPITSFLHEVPVVVLFYNMILGCLNINLNVVLYLYCGQPVRL